MRSAAHRAVFAALGLQSETLPFTLRLLDVCLTVARWRASEQLYRHFGPARFE
jgi:type III secretory pathway component EscS